MWLMAEFRSQVLGDRQAYRPSELGTLSLGKDFTPHPPGSLRKAWAPTSSVSSWSLAPSPHASFTEKGSRSERFFDVDAVHSIYTPDTQEITIFTAPNLHVFTSQPSFNCLPGPEQSSLSTTSAWLGLRGSLNSVSFQEGFPNPQNKIGCPSSAIKNKRERNLTTCHNMNGPRGCYAE